MNRKIIGICGQARSGKDTVADFLVGEYNFRKIAFADKLKWLIKDLFFLTHAQLYGEYKEEKDEIWGKSPRVIMQQVGDKLREVNPDIWIKHVVRHVDAISDVDFVISDIRYKNEFVAVKEMGATIWLIKRPDAPEVEGTNVHPSESEMLEIPEEDFDNIIFANSVEEILQKVNTLMFSLKGSNE